MVPWSFCSVCYVLPSVYEKVASDYLVRIEILGCALETATLDGSRWLFDTGDCYVGSFRSVRRNPKDYEFMIYTGSATCQ